MRPSCMLPSSTGFRRVLWEGLRVVLWREAEVLLKDEEERVRFPARVGHPWQRHVLAALVRVLCVMSAGGHVLAPWDDSRARICENVMQPRMPCRTGRTTLCDRVSFHQCHTANLASTAGAAAAERPKLMMGTTGCSTRARYESKCSGWESSCETMTASIRRMPLWLHMPWKSTLLTHASRDAHHGTEPRPMRVE